MMPTTAHTWTIARGSLEGRIRYGLTDGAVEELRSHRRRRNDQHRQEQTNATLLQRDRRHTIIE